MSGFFYLSLGEPVNAITVCGQYLVLMAVLLDSFWGTVPVFTVAVNNHVLSGYKEIRKGNAAKGNLFLIEPPPFLHGLLYRSFDTGISFRRVLGRVYSYAFGGAAILPPFADRPWRRKVFFSTNVTDSLDSVEPLGFILKVFWLLFYRLAVCCQPFYVSHFIVVLLAMAAPLGVISNHLVTPLILALNHLPYRADYFVFTSAAILTPIGGWFPTFKTVIPAMFTIFYISRILKSLSAVVTSIIKHSLKQNNPLRPSGCCLGSIRKIGFGGLVDDYIPAMRIMLPRHAYYTTPVRLNPMRYQDAFGITAELIDTI